MRHRTKSHKQPKVKHLYDVSFLQLIRLNTIHESKQIREPSDKFLMHI